jgi:HlyD family secretion protein
VVISTENPDELLLPGMTANLQVVVAKRVDALKVPNMALRFRLSGQLEEVRAEAGAFGAEPGLTGRVFVLDEEGHPRPVKLRLGITDGRATEVLAGDLKEGQLVITGTAATQSAPEATSSLLNLRLR